MAPATANTMGLFVGAALVDTWTGAEDGGEGIFRIMAVEAGIVDTAGGAVTVEETGTITEV
jgi:hypothetical protein